MKLDEKKVIHAQLLSVYSLYPKKMGKSEGMQKATRQIKTLEDLELLTKATMNYAAYVKQNGTEARYILYFSTFMNQWRDWLEEDVGTVKAQDKIDRRKLGFE